METFIQPHPHADLRLTPDQLTGGYADLLRILSADEPDAVRRALHTLMMLPPAQPEGSAESPSVMIARAWLGDSAAAAHAPGEGRHGFSYPAHVAFDVAGAPSPQAAHRIARAAINRLLDSGTPLGVIPGSLQGEPHIHDLVVWLGSSENDAKDVLELEEYTDPKSTHT